MLELHKARAGKLQLLVRGGAQMKRRGQTSTTLTLLYWIGQGYFLIKEKNIDIVYIVNSIIIILII